MSTEALRGGLEALVLRLSSRYARLCTFAQGDWDTLDGESLVEADHLNHLLTELRALLAEHPPADLPVATGDAGTEVDPVLIDAVRYYAERRTMNNPKGWDHVHRNLSQAAAAGAYGDRPTGPALAAIAALADAEHATSAAGSSPEDADGIEALVERSSLGTPEAAALRATVSDERAAQIVARVKELEAAGCQCPPCPGRGNDGHGMTHCAECCFGTGVKADPGCPVHGEDAGEWVALSEKWLSAAEAARKAEHHFPADCLAEAAQVVQGLYGHLAAAEQEAAALREQVAAASAFMEPQWHTNPGHEYETTAAAYAAGRNDLIDKIRAALADPASVLAQRDAEVGAKALERLADDIEPGGFGWTSLENAERFKTRLRERARGLRQGVDRG